MKGKIMAALENLEPQLKRTTQLIKEAEEEGIYSNDDPEAQYLWGMHYKISDNLNAARRLIRQINAPVSEEGILHKNSNGRYELPSGNCLSSNSAIEYLFIDNDGPKQWVYSRIEHNGSDYFIVSNPKLSMEGLHVRVKQLPFWD